MLKRKKVLLIEDDEQLAELWIALLSIRGHTVIWVTNATDAIRAYDEQGPWDLVVLDGELADGSSFEPVINHIRIVRMDATTHVMANSAKRELRQKQRDLGCDLECIEKPLALSAIELALAA